MLDEPTNHRRFTANSASRVRGHNRRVLLHALRLHGTLSRAELARATGLTPQAIANIVEDLLAAGLVRKSGRRKAPRGQPPIGIEIAKDGGYAVGVRVDATHYYAVAADLSRRSHRNPRGAGSEPRARTSFSIFSPTSMPASRAGSEPTAALASGW